MDTGCLQILAIMKNASMNMEVQVFLETCDLFPSGIYSEVGLLDHIVVFFFFFFFRKKKCDCPYHLFS